MKNPIAALALAGLLAACAAQTTTPIQSMNDDGITVAYVDGFAGTKDTDKVAMQHCASARRTDRTAISGWGIDETVVHYGC
jgi:hypothetical protein